MSHLVLRYQYNAKSHRGLAATGVLLVKSLLVLPHLLVTSIMQILAQVLAYFGFWIVAFTGEMPQAVHRLIEISFGWTARMWAWLAGITDVYPPFETDPEYAVQYPVARPESPSRGWAVAGLLLAPKLIVVIPHLIALAILSTVALLVMWVGYVIAVFTGALPKAIQDFAAGVLLWELRVAGWFAGITDEYPPFRLEARPTQGQTSAT